MDPAKIQWGSAGAQYVVESTGAFTGLEGAGKHMAGKWISPPYLVKKIQWVGGITSFHISGGIGRTPTC